MYTAMAGSTAGPNANPFHFSSILANLESRPLTIHAQLESLDPQEGDSR